MKFHPNWQWEILCIFQHHIWFIQFFLLFHFIFEFFVFYPQQCFLMLMSYNEVMHNFSYHLCCSLLLARHGSYNCALPKCSGKMSLFLWVSQFRTQFSSISVERGCKKHVVLIPGPVPLILPRHSAIQKWMWETNSRFYICLPWQSSWELPNDCIVCLL